MTLKVGVDRRRGRQEHGRQKHAAQAALPAAYDAALYAGSVAAQVSPASYLWGGV